MPTALLTAADLIPDHVLAETDTDRLRHEPIVREVAALATAVETPSNIVLFGPWGSGKSSVLQGVRRTLHGCDVPVKVVRYDAWKYGGGALQRNFIYHAATELGVNEDDDENREYFRGLYESRRSGGIRLGEVLRSGWRSVIRGLLRFAGAIAAIWLVTALVLLWMGFGFLVERGTAALLGLLPFALIAPLLLGTVQAALADAHMTFEQSAPSTDEQFGRTFKSLIKQARARAICPAVGRLVFLIDELDRCSAEDVVSTLTALKTFLDEEHCVFIVAIDREVLESALQKAPPQVTPADDLSPYYSSASAYIDKIFQYQLTLPPLRRGRLGRLAAELVEGRGGIWQELAETSLEGTSALDLVLYVLIPSHVRSPRRVKVLLNNFATHARLAQARGIAVVSRSAEIAKLMALETEFPLFAADLHHERRLPSLLLGLGIDADLPERVRTLLAKYAAAATPLREEIDTTQRAAPAAGQDPQSLTATAAVPLDPPITTDPGAEGALKATQYRQLRLYLQRTATIPDPGRDLLYLEQAGVYADLHDTELGQLIEDLAPDDPDTLLGRLRQEPVEEQAKAVKVLLDMVGNESGIERSKCASALIHLGDAMGPNLLPLAAQVAEALNAYRLEMGLRDRDLAACLRITVVAGSAGKPLQESVVADSRTLANQESLLGAARLLSNLPAELGTTVRERLVAAVKASPANLHDFLPGLARDDADYLLEQTRTEFTGAINAAEDDETPEAAATIIGNTWKAIDKVVGVDHELRADLNWILLTCSADAAYAGALEHSPALLPSIDRVRATRHCLVAIARAPEEDWPLWMALLAGNT